MIAIFVSHRFVLSSIESSSRAEPVIHYWGLSTEAVASGLKPFTQYTVVLQVGAISLENIGIKYVHMCIHIPEDGSGYCGYSSFIPLSKDIRIWVN